MSKRRIVAVVGLIAGLSPALSQAQGKSPKPELYSSNIAAPFCYPAGGTRTWTILSAPLDRETHLTLTATRDDQELASGEELSFSGLKVIVSRQGKLEIRTQRDGRISFKLKVKLTRGDGNEASQTLEVRPAPPPRPISYIADILDEMIYIYWDAGTGHFRPIEQSGFDQYFRRLQAHGVSRLIVSLSSFPFIADPKNYAPEDWNRFDLQARGILESQELAEIVNRPGAVKSWAWLRETLKLRLSTDFGRVLSQSARDHNIALAAEFRPFENALTKYYEVPAFDENGQYLWGFLPAASPTLACQPDQAGFAHYRRILAEMGKADLGTLDAMTISGVRDAAAVVRRVTSGQCEVQLFATQFPPLSGEAFVLCRQLDGTFKLRRYREIREQADSHRLPITKYQIETLADDVVRIGHLNIPAHFRYLTLSANQGANDGIDFDPFAPVTLWSKAGNRIGRENLWWALDEAAVGADATRVAGKPW